MPLPLPLHPPDTTPRGTTPPNTAPPGTAPLGMGGQDVVHQDMNPRGTSREATRQKGMVRVGMGNGKAEQMLEHDRSKQEIGLVLYEDYEL